MNETKKNAFANELTDEAIGAAVPHYQTFERRTHMQNFSPELIEKARSAQSPEELLAMAKAENMELTAEEAATYFAQLHSKTGELDDDELENVSGGLYKGDRLIVSAFHICQLWRCDNCYQSDVGGKRNKMDVHKCSASKGGGTVFANCTNCYCCSYEKGLWLCNAYSKRKK